MLNVLEAFFSRALARRQVATEFLRLGLKVNARGKILVGAIEVSPVKIARALNVDRRVVIDTAKAIARDAHLLQVFHRLESRAFLGKAAKDLGFSAIELRANPNEKGIVAAVSRVLAEEGIVIRQIISDDPDLFPDPVLTIIVGKKLPAAVMEKLRGLEFAESISFA
ncbi:MAG: ACT domain-containing protein [Candidatus Diapherotrites archaeon]|nr:ACT domain-containing protein [Candidatus Diapherotrites archaeon]